MEIENQEKRYTDLITTLKDERNNLEDFAK